jgi:alcohol dehydrogenase
MKAIRLEKPGQFNRIEIDEPARPGPAEAVVRVRRVGVCGTDFSGFHGRMPFYSYPRIPGHELGVEVVSVGDRVGNVKPGDRCAVEPYLNCETCLACRRGASNCCMTLQVLGVHTDGGLRDRFVLPARKLHPSPKLTLDQLALVETLGIGGHAVERGAPRDGEDLLIVGAGPIGLSVLEFARAAGAKVTVVDVNPARLDFCRKTMGASQTVLLKGDGSELKELEGVTSGNLFPVVIDATGNVKSMSNATSYVAHTGRLVYVGITSESMSIAHPLMHRREISILASRNSVPETFRKIIALIEEGRIDTRPWITHRSPFEGFIDAFPAWTKPETGVVKAMVEVS